MTLLKAVQDGLARAGAIDVESAEVTNGQQAIESKGESGK